MPPSSAQRFVRTDGFVAAELEGETFLLDVSSGSYYRINVTGSRVWELLAQPRTVSEVAALLCEAFSVAEATCEQEVATFVQGMCDAGLLQPA